MAEAHTHPRGCPCACDSLWPANPPVPPSFPTISLTRRYGDCRVDRRRGGLQKAWPGHRRDASRIRVRQGLCARSRARHGTLDLGFALDRLHAHNMPEAGSCAMLTMRPSTYAVQVAPHDTVRARFNFSAPCPGAVLISPSSTLGVLFGCFGDVAVATCRLQAVGRPGWAAPFRRSTPRWCDRNLGLSFGDPFLILSFLPPHTRRVMCSAWPQHSSDAA